VSAQVDTMGADFAGQIDVVIDKKQCLMGETELQ
jgi:hypothetical protein